MDVAALLARYEKVSADAETKLLKEITEAGWEAGCWARVPQDKLVVATREELREITEGLRSRKAGREVVADPFPNGRPQEEIDGKEPCYVIVSQRCDIVGLLKAEPLVELAPAFFCDDKNRISASWKNSAREFPIDHTAAATYIVDLRYRYYLPKIDLADLAPKQALPASDRVRERFVLRTSQRYTRAAVPDHLVEKVVLPLLDAIKKDSDANAIFSEWALFHGGRREAKPGILATYIMDLADGLSDDELAEAEDRIRRAAEDKFQAIIDGLPKSAKEELDLDDDARTRAVSETELTVAAWRLSWKLEWDYLSFSGDPDAATPAR
jgi:hypothetical protein